ncbi:MAG TPA: Do family serine endopeptidase [Rhizomicrobium sp.]|nr:Do family serine endopeptidase [Rhizomicrobium sp.]
MAMESKQKKRREDVRTGLLAALSAGVIFAVGALAAPAQTPHPATRAQAAQPRVVEAATQVARAEPPRPMASAAAPRMLENGAPFSFADLVERVSPSVVTVTVEEEIQPTQDLIPDNIPEPFRNFFNQFGNGQPQRPRKAVAMGSGFIVDRSGLIVTNNHVIDKAKKITVKMTDGREFDARLVGTDPATDIAVLKVRSDKPLPAVEFVDDHQVRVGDWVIAVGNPFGLSNTVTAGIVSSIGRDVGNGPYTDFIQVDAPINRGNSGGPTFNLQGKVIGMNSMIFSPSGGSVGIGFAIPSSTIRSVISQLEAHGHVTRGYLGVQIQSVTPDIAASVGRKDNKGAIVASIVPGGPAARAGVQQGDIVLALNGKSIEDSRDLTRRVADLPAGSTATFTIDRSGQPKTITVKIGVRKDEQQADNDNNPHAQANAGGSTGEAMGLGLAAITPSLREQFNLENGVNGVVITRVDPDSDAADKGLEAGDVVLSVANRPVHTPADIKSRIADAHAAGRDTVLVLVLGNGGQRYLALKIT